MSGEPHGNLYALFQSRFPEDRERTFIETPEGERYTYRDLEERSARIAGHLDSLGVRPGDRVAVQVAKSPQALFTYLACIRAGYVYLPLNTAYPERELEYFIEDAEPSAFVGQAEHAEVLASLTGRLGVKNLLTLDARGGGTLTEAAAQAPPLDAVNANGPDDLAAILYTSGTTGRPKGAMLTHANLASNALTLHRAWGFGPDDVLLHALPIFHTHGLFVACHCVLLNGSGMFLLGRFDVDTVLSLMPRSTVFMGVPTFYTRLLASPAFDRGQCENIRLFVSGSAPLLVQTFDEFEIRTGHRILERYGMTECGMSTSNPLDGERKPGTVGPPLPGVDLRIVDDAGAALPPGEIGGVEFKGPNVFKGYWRKPDKTAEDFTDDGYFRSGDLGTLDEDGYVSIVGRDKDLIISGGFNVYPKEVEYCLDQLSGVQESAVVGLPHPDFGEAVAAAVVPGPGADDLTEAEILDFLKPMLANYKVPKRVAFVVELPRNAMGKVQKNVLRERLADELGPLG